MTPPTPEGVRVPVTVPGHTRAYDVIVRPGALADLPRLLHTHAPAARYALIADATVAALHGRTLLDELRGRDLSAELFSFEAGEAHKTRASWSALTDRMLERGFGRDACVIALGGGVTGDLAGFVAATYMRGLPLVQVPTSLLAMIDAAVGGKTGVDVPAGKNLVGAFHAPRLVVADPLVLRTLPEVELRAGLAEALKHGAILDAEYFDWVVAHLDALRSLQPEAAARLVARSVELKAEVVAADPLEQGCRAVLNFGHTVGHALELCTRYALPHGFAVGLGMIAEARAGELADITETGSADRLRAALRLADLPVAAQGVDADHALAAMRLDKKARRAVPRFALLATLGACARDPDGGWTHALPEAALRTALREIILDSSTV